MVDPQLRVERFVPEQTARWIASEARRSLYDVQILDLARFLVSRLREEHPDQVTSAISEIWAVSHFVRQHLRYTRDPWGVELVYGAPGILFRIRRFGRFAEDCDGFAMLTGALLLAIGYRVSLVLVNYIGEYGWNHIINAVHFNDRQVVYIDNSMKEYADQALTRANNVLFLPI